MPVGINKLDTYLDEKFVDSKRAFADAMSLVVMDGCDPREALNLYLEERTGKIGEIIEESYKVSTAEKQADMIDLRDRLHIYQDTHVNLNELNVYEEQVENRIEKSESG